ncbi:MAG TPA: RNA methyltransferase [Caulobacteraceae bacterium]|jgi:tRNA/rRNA methyltransferase|nr:RNA methyltransferase [Caulobacteraceae bacterium]
MDRPCIILKDAQLAENIGAAARVMANFGLAELRLVNPRDGWPQPRAWASASGANWPLDEARVFTALPEAIADLTLVLATTARPREAILPVLSPREGAAQLKDACRAGAACGLLFGGERAGLEADDIALCQAIITAPVDERHHSLNLAQAVAITAYEWATTASEGVPPAFAGAPAPAGQGALLGFYEQLEAELDTAGFFHPAEKRPSMVRNLRVALGRARFTDQEVRTLRGVVTALSRGRGQVLEKLAARKAARLTD